MTSAAFLSIVTFEIFNRWLASTAGGMMSSSAIRTACCSSSSGLSRFRHRPCLWFIELHLSPCQKDDVRGPRSPKGSK